MRKWSIYKLLCPVASKVKYVGITSRPLQERLQTHLRGKDHNPDKDKWIAWLDAQGFVPLIEEIDSYYGTRAQAERREQYWVYEYIRMGHDLLNRKHIPYNREAFFNFLRNQAKELSARKQMRQYHLEVSGMLQQCSEQIEG